MNNKEIIKYNLNFNDYLNLKNDEANIISCLKLNNCYILNNGCLFKDKIYHYNKWYNNINNFNINNFKISNNFLNFKVLSLIQVYNYSFQHITFDTLPKLTIIKELLEKEKNLKILVINNTQKNLLNFFLNIDDRYYIYPENNYIYKVNIGYYINSYNSDNKNIKMGSFGSNFFSKYLIQSNFFYYNHNKKLEYFIYISRRNNNKRYLNFNIENKLIKIMYDYCYKKNLKFKIFFNPDNSNEFKNIISKSKIFITLHGGAMGNVIYLNKNSKVIEIIPKKYLKERPCYYYLCNSMNINYNIFEPINFDFNKNIDINIDLDKFVNFLYCL